MENPRYSGPTKANSILSEKGWTPLLNDALIIGAITGSQGFVLGLTESEASSWEKIKAAGNGDPKETWRQFFHHNQQMIYDPKFGIPRVFARELMGLATFGYRPEFTMHQLGFYPTPGTPADPTFKAYVEALNSKEFHHKTNRQQIVEAVSEFLFGDAGAIVRK